MKSQLEFFGSTYISRLAMRDAWAFVGQHGLEGRSTIEEVLLSVVLSIFLARTFYAE